MIPLKTHVRGNGVIFRRYIVVLALGAATFWLPTVILHAYAGCEARTINVAPWATAVAPVTGSLGLAFFRRRQRPMVRASLMLLGVWALGSLFMSLSATFCGGGFHQAGSILATVLGFLPPYAFIMATYDGSLGALLVVTVLLPAAGAALELFSWLRARRTVRIPNGAN